MNQKNSQGISWMEYIFNFTLDVLQYWHRILLCAVFVAVVGSVIMTVTYKPTYRTEASVIINSDIYDGEENLSEVPEALSYVLKSNLFLDRIKKDMKMDDINGSFNVEGMTGTNVIKISATASSPRVSYRMMYFMLKRYKSAMKNVVGDMSFRIIDNIDVPTAPINPLNAKRNLIIFGAIGALLMTAALVMKSYLRDSIKSRSDVKEKLQVRMLADIATESKWTFKGRKPIKKRGLLVTQLSTSFSFVETMKRLATRFEVIAQKNGYKTVLVNSTWEDEGKTSVIANLAITLAQMNRKVLIVDTDFGKPALNKILSAEPEHGLEEVLHGSVTFDQVIVKNKKLKLDCVYVKEVISDATELLEGDKLKECFDSVRDQYDYILIDTPPSSFIGMANIIAQHCDGVILVARQNFAPTVLINRTIENFLAQETPVIGCVLNRSMPRFGHSRRGYE